MKSKAMVALTALALASLPASAQAQAPAASVVAVGATVYGPQGNEVGKIEQVSGQSVVINTGTHSATLAASSFGRSDKGPTIGFTRAQLNEAVENAERQAAARVDAAITVGATLHSNDGVALATIKSIGDDGQIEFERESGTFVMAKDAVYLNDKGLYLNFTAQEFENNAH